MTQETTTGFLNGKFIFCGPNVNPSTGECHAIYSGTNVTDVDFPDLPAAAAMGSENMVQVGDDELWYIGGLIYRKSLLILPDRRLCIN